MEFKIIMLRNGWKPNLEIWDSELQFPVNVTSIFFSGNSYGQLNGHNPHATGFAKTNTRRMKQNDNKNTMFIVVWNVTLQAHR